MKSRTKTRAVSNSAMKLLVFMFCFSVAAPVQAQDQELVKSEIIYKGLQNPTSIYVTRNHIYIVDQDENQLIKLDHFGNVRDRIGGSGSGDYQFSTPVDVDATNGLKIYISDYNNRRIQVFDRRGQYLSSLETPENLNERRSSPTQIAVNDIGEVFFYNESDKSIRKYGFNGSYSDSYPLPRTIAQVDDIVFKNRTFYVLDKKKSVIHVLSENWIPETFYPAPRIEAFAVTDEEVWHFTKNGIKAEGRDGIRQFKWRSHFAPVDAQFLDDILFVVDSRNVYKLSKPE